MIIRRIFIVLFLLIFLSIILREFIIKEYISYKFSKWAEREVKIEKLIFKFPNQFIIKNIVIFNKNPNFYKKNFSSENINIDIDVKSYLFSDLVIINSLSIENSNFFLEIVKNSKNKNNQKGKDEIIYMDNIGLAEKNFLKKEPKVWPIKKKDVNFLIKKTYLSNTNASIYIPSIPIETKITLSNFQFSNVGNDLKAKHYKDVFKILLLDTFASVKIMKIKSLLKTIYNF